MNCTAEHGAHSRCGWFPLRSGVGREAGNRPVATLAAVEGFLTGRPQLCQGAAIPGERLLQQADPHRHDRFAAGVEKAVEAGDPQQADAAIQRIKLLNSVVLSLPGVPMLNLMGGDDRGQVNDYSFREDPIRGKDNRWANRVERNVSFGKKTPLEVEVMSRVFNDTLELNRVRAEEMPAFDAGPMQVIDTGKPPVLAFARAKAQQKVVVLANFSHRVQKINAESLRAHGMTEAVIDKIGQQKDQVQKIGTEIELAPYQCMWLVPARSDRSSVD
jgi:hypothetical protein